jgi:hypothetical protein
MSASTRSRRAERRARRYASLALAACAFALSSVVPAAAPPLPDPVAALAPEVRPLGGGEMRVLGFPIYDGWYWASAREFSIAQPFALDLHYHRALDGAKIAERSIEEIAKLGYGTAAERSRWAEAMKAIFPSVGRGDRLTGVNVPSLGARFFHNGKLIGEVADPSFAHAFFGIWLDPRTSRPDFRERLLGRAGSPR